METQQAGQKEKMVNVRMGELKRAIDRIEEAASQLTNTLDPVLDPPMPAEAEKKPPEEAQGVWCNLAIEIRGQECRANNLATFLDYTKSRLQV